MNTEFEKKLVLVSERLIWLIIFSSLVCLFYVFYKCFYVFGNWNPNEQTSQYKNYYYPYIYFFLFFISFWLVIIFFTNKLKPLILIFFISIIFSLYLVEILFLSNIWLHFKKTHHYPNFDKRSKFEVIMDLNDKDVISAISPKRVFVDDSGIKQIVPLSAVSNIKTVMCNERGEWIIYQSDRYGFNNPDKAWEKKNNDFIIVGDSFAYGACVYQNENISSKLREQNFNNLNLAFQGNGPLAMLGTVKEYHGITNPKYVLWLYYEGNDLIDLEREMNYKSFNFSNYLKKDFSQNLVLRQKEVDNILNELYQKKLIERLERVSKKHKKKIKNNKMIDEIHNFDFKKMLKLYNIRTLLGIINMDHPPYLYKKFKKIIKEAKDFSETNNSELVFVYLPRYYKTMAHVNIYNKKKIINLVEDLNIRVIDIDKLVFKKHSDPLSLFPFRRKNHYSSEGYALVAKEISKFFLEQ